MANNKQLILLEEQTILSRERTMQQYMSTGLAFIGVGLIVVQVLAGDIYKFIGGALILVGFWQIYLAHLRFRKYRGLAKKLRRKERKFGLEIGE